MIKPSILILLCCKKCRVRQIVWSMFENNLISAWYQIWKNMGTSEVKKWKMLMNPAEHCQISTQRRGIVLSLIPRFFTLEIGLLRDTNHAQHENNNTYRENSFHPHSLRRSQCIISDWMEFK
jgi:hypothetical protein